MMTIAQQAIGLIRRHNFDMKGFLAFLRSLVIFKVAVKFSRIMLEEYSFCSELATDWRHWVSYRGTGQGFSFLHKVLKPSQVQCLQKFFFSTGKVGVA
jgi:hypothetical protein